MRYYTIVDKMIAVAIATVCFVVVFCLPDALIHPLAWGELCEGAGIMPPSHWAGGWWRLGVKSLFTCVGITKGVWFLKLAGALLLSVLAGIMYLLPCYFISIFDSDDYLFHTNRAIRMAAIVGAILCATTGPIWCVGHTGLPDLWRLVMIAISLFAYMHHLASGRLMSLAVASSLLGFLIIDMSIGVVLFIWFMALYIRDLQLMPTMPSVRVWSGALLAFFIGASVALGADLVGSYGKDLITGVQEFPANWMTQLKTLFQLDVGLLLFLSLIPFILINSSFSKAIDCEIPFKLDVAIILFLLALLSIFLLVGHAIVASVLEGLSSHYLTLVVFFAALVVSYIFTFWGIDHFSRRYVRFDPSEINGSFSRRKFFHIGMRGYVFYAVCAVCAVLGFAQIILSPTRPTLAALNEVTSAFIEDARDCQIWVVDEPLSNLMRLKALEAKSTAKVLSSKKWREIEQQGGMDEALKAGVAIWGVSDLVKEDSVQKWSVWGTCVKSRAGDEAKRQKSCEKVQKLAPEVTRLKRYRKLLPPNIANCLENLSKLTGASSLTPNS